MADRYQVPRAMGPLCQQPAKLFDRVFPAPSRHIGIPYTLLHICNRTRHYIYTCVLNQFLLARRVAVGITQVTALILRHDCTASKTRLPNLLIRETDEALPCLICRVPHIVC